MLNRSILVTALSLSLCSFLWGGCAGTKKDPEQPEQLVTVAIKLLEAKDYTAFIERFWPPAVLEKHKEVHSTDDIDEIAKKTFGDRPDQMARLVSTLKLLKDTKPVFNDDRTRATFRGKDADGKSIEFPFTLIDGKWCLTLK